MSGVLMINKFFFVLQAQEKTVDDLWRLVRHDVADAEDDGFGVVDKSAAATKKKEKLSKKIIKKVSSLFYGPIQCYLKVNLF